MGKIDRLKRITLGRIEAFLETLEKPEYILPQLVREMSDLVREAADAKAKALSAVKAARRRLDEANGKVLRLQNGIQLAVQADEMETARQAIAVQIQAEQQAQKCRADLETTEKAYQAADQAYCQLVISLEQLKQKKAQLLRRYRHQELARNLQQQYCRSVIDPNKDVWETISRMEDKLQQQQFELQAQTELIKTLGVGFQDERIETLEHDAEVDRRLETIKKQCDKHS